MVAVLVVGVSAVAVAAVVVFLLVEAESHIGRPEVV